MPRMKLDRLSNLPIEIGLRTPLYGRVDETDFATARLRESSVAQPPNAPSMAMATNTGTIFLFIRMPRKSDGLFNTGQNYISIINSNFRNSFIDKQFAAFLCFRSVPTNIAKIATRCVFRFLNIVPPRQSINT
jgi:hypothetical protein